MPVRKSIRNFGAVLSQVRRDRQQQRPGSRDHHAFAANRQARLDHRLQAARSHHIRQSPSRKRQESFSRSGCQNQILISQFAADRHLPPPEALRPPAGERLSSHKVLATFAERNRSIHFAASVRCFVCPPPRQICPPKAKLSSTTPTRAPYSAARTAAAMPAGPRRPPAHRSVAANRYSSVFTSIPGAHRIWQLRQCGFPLIRHATFEANPHPAQRGRAVRPSPRFGKLVPQSPRNRDGRPAGTTSPETR